MPSDKPSYSSAALRARDERIQEKYDNENEALRRRHAFAQGATNMSLFELHNRSQRLADLLGYANLSEAIIEIETADIGVTFRQCLHRLQAAEARLDVEKTDHQIVQIKLKNLEKEHQTLKDEKRKLERSYRQLQAEKKDLDSRYDHLADIRQRADARYKIDYKKWKAFYLWLKSDGPDEDHPGVSIEDKKQISKLDPNIARKRQAVIDGLINVSFMDQNPEDCSTPRNAPPPLGGIEMKYDKENEGTSPSPRKRCRIAKPSASPPPPSNTLLQPVTNTVNSSLSATAAPTPSHLYNIQVEREQTCVLNPVSLKPTDTGDYSPPASQRIPNSSDTEEDTQSIWIPMKRHLEQTSVFETPAQPVASSSKTTFNANLSPPPTVVKTTPGRKRPRASLAEPVRECRISPSKNRRHSVHERPTHTPREVFSSRKGKERQMQEKEKASSIRDEYSIFKGRGRYGKAKEPENTTINAMYAINPANNGGLDYQYDEVVRNRDARKKMHAGDCECCKEYYEAVGPLPSRLQQPLWRSPTSSPQKRDRPGPSRRQAEIDSHKKAISRHRHAWARAPTPPGYWDIGFPNTQEVSVINAKATEMHQRKKEEVGGEAARGGRYRRKS